MNKLLLISGVAVATMLVTSCQKDEGVAVDPMTEVVDCDNVTSVFSINLTTDGCTVDIASELNATSQYDESISGGDRVITYNNIPDHLVGTFPNGGNPNTISEQDKTMTVPAAPQLANSSTSGQGYVGGILFSGVTLETFTAEFFVGSTGTTNMGWNINTFQSTRDLGLDCNNAHVQPTGSYHYHGIPNAFGSDRSIDGSTMVKVGYASDGFPIYYKYFENSTGSIEVAEASYELIDGARGGDGVSAPDGCHDGYYFQDYEYVDGTGDLDACNGRFGPTPEAADGEYYYVLTEDFPSAPICFSGTPDQSTRLGG